MVFSMTLLFVRFGLNGLGVFLELELALVLDCVQISYELPVLDFRPQKFLVVLSLFWLFKKSRFDLDVCVEFTDLELKLPIPLLRLAPQFELLLLDTFDSLLVFKLQLSLYVRC